MELVKTYGEIRKGDVVRRVLGGERERVLKTEETNTGVYLTLSPSEGVECMWYAPASKPIILVHRPMTEKQRSAALTVIEINAIADVTGRICSIKKPDMLPSLRVAIEDWELGKPAEPTAGLDSGKRRGLHNVLA